MITATDWFVATQRGWFAEFGTKGVEFPQHWATTLQAFTSHHPDAWRQRGRAIDVTSLPGGALISLLIQRETAWGELSTRNCRGGCWVMPPAAVQPGAVLRYTNDSYARRAMQAVPPPDGRDASSDPTLRASREGCHGPN